MSVLAALAILVAGMAAGTINTVVGSGTLITFPVLLFLGYPPVVANVSNTVGLVAGGVTAVHGYRAELRGQAAPCAAWLRPRWSAAIVGAVLLLVLPPAAFQAIVPVLIALGAGARRARVRGCSAAPPSGTRRAIAAGRLARRRC